MESYSEEFQIRAADELDALPVACSRTEVTPDCSALATLIPDYLTLRDKIRAAQ